LIEIFLVVCSSLDSILIMNFVFVFLDIEPSVKTLLIGYSDEVIDCVVTNLATVTGQSVCRYVDFLPR